jgi:hypothetical protein
VDRYAHEALPVGRTVVGVVVEDIEVVRSEELRVVPQPDRKEDRLVVDHGDQGPGALGVEGDLVPLDLPFLAKILEPVLEGMGRIDQRLGNPVVDLLFFRVRIFRVAHRIADSTVPQWLCHVPR